MSWQQFLATALVVGVIGPLFWLGVNVFENALKSWANRALQRWRAKKARAQGRLLK